MIELGVLVYLLGALFFMGLGYAAVRTIHWIWRSEP
jgi:hypothetical protein